MRDLLIKYKKQLLPVALLLLLIGGLTLWLGWEYREELKQFVSDARVWTTAKLTVLHPVVFVLVFGLAPLALFPISILYMTAGAYGLVQGLIMVWLGLAINIALGYWLARGFMRKWILFLAARMNYTIPQVEGGSAVKLSLVVRIVPGLPFGMQNYFLGLAAVPFKIYFPISMAVQGTIGTVMVIAGGSALRGNYGMALTAIGLFVLLTVIISILRKRYVRMDAENKA
ncbi:MAG: hypothetical protein SFY80_06095 [Verrucomicrobiota bacterium]|nr:hypothetical protein [Verrucomicrobiota bacterium]